MTRPAVIIGLGGTGQWVLTYLKKDLLELHNGKIPHNVRLLAFDTVSEAEAQDLVAGGLYRGDQAAYEKAPKRIGTVELDRDVELVHLGGDCYELGNAIDQGRYPHLNWFDASYWLRTLPRDQWILDRGAGRFRQFGLLAVYKDLMGGSVRSQILTRLPGAVDSVRANVEGSPSFELIMVCSLAGGTGSAMLVPMGVLARKMFGQALVRTRALVVLPTAFSPGKRNTELELRGGAALRELARAMMPPEGFATSLDLIPGHREYGNGNLQYRQPFDGIYFVDGMKGGRPINVDTRYGVCPAAAIWIRQILDDKAGQWFARYGETNLRGAMALDTRRMAEGVFGVFGVKSLTAPERTLRQTYRLKMADRFLHELTGPKPEGAGGRLISDRTPRGVAEAPDLAYSWLQQTASFGTEQQPITALMGEIARIVQDGGKDSPTEVQRKAQVGVQAMHKSELEAYSWQAPLTKLPEGARFDALLQDIERELRADFRKRFVPGDAHSPPREPGSQAAYVDFTRDLDFFVHEHHGGMGADGPDDFGTFGTIIARCADAQVGVFRDVLRLRIQALLAENQGRNRLGYAIRILEALDKHFEDFGEFMEEVERKRSQLPPMNDLIQKVETSKKNWLSARNVQPSLLEKLQGMISRKTVFSGKAIQAEKAYLRAQANLVDYMREITLHKEVKRAAKEMREYAAESRRELVRWEATLLEGDKAMDIDGLLTRAKADLDRTLATIHDDQRSEEVEELVQVDSPESQINAADVQWALDGVRWVASHGGKGLRFVLELQPQGVERGQLDIVREGMSRTERQRVAERNSTTLDRVLDQRFGQVDHVKTALAWCTNHDLYADPSKLAAELVEEAQLLADLAAHGQPAMETFSVSIAHEEDAVGYTGDLEEALRLKLTGDAVARNDRPIEVLDCDEPYRLTAVRVQMGLTVEEFSTYEVCQDAYRSELDRVDGAPHRAVSDLTKMLQSHYTQKEEKAAIAQEVRLRSEGWAHRFTNPRIVSLLGEEHRLKDALQCWALSWVKPVVNTRQADLHHWELQIPGESGGSTFWLTRERRRDEVGVLEALEAFVLVAQNRAPDRADRLDWKVLEKALELASKSADGEPSPRRKALDAALAPAGLIEEWEAVAVKRTDSATQRVTYQNPAYHDLADYAKRYFKSLGRNAMSPARGEESKGDDVASAQDTTDETDA